jgi:prolyl-tRNA synthetase
VDSHHEFLDSIHDRETKGVSLRIELGPKDLENNQCVFARRDWREGDEEAKKKVTTSYTQHADDAHTHTHTHIT